MTSLRAPALLLLAALAACAAGPAQSDLPPEIFGPPNPAPHSRAEIDRFETYRGPGGETTAAGWRTHFLEERLHRAFAVSPHHFGYRVGAASAAMAADAAMAACTRAAATSAERCVLYAVDTQIVLPGQEAALPFRGRPIGPFTPSPEYRYRGPAAARGLVVWSHGRTGGGDDGCDRDGAKSAAPAIVTLFNRDGWDVLRFNRDPCRDDMTDAVDALAPGVAEAKRLGYRRVVLAGQSRGATQSLEALRMPDMARDVDAVLAFSPARSGQKTLAETLAPARWRTLVDALAGPELVAVFYFDHDPFNPRARDQAAYAADAWRTRMPNAHVYYETDPSFTNDGTGMPNGHFGAARPAFPPKYAACLTTMIDTGRADGPCATPP